MASIKRFLAQINNNLQSEKRNINQLFLSSSHTITELYKTNSYVEQLKAIIKKLNNLLLAHEKFQKTTPPQIRKTKEYAKLVNQVAVEFQYLIATNQAMNDNLEEIRKTEGIQCNISGKMMHLKKEINKIIKKAQKVLKG
jgi:transcriptional regulator with GAF, ATPase, and Fis domain